MNKQRALELLTRSKPELARRFGVTRLALFGSTVRDQATAQRDVDDFVSFAGPANSKRYFGGQLYLEDVFGCPVDLVADKALRAELSRFSRRERWDC